MTTMPMTVQERIPLALGEFGRAGAAVSGFTFGDLIRILKQRMFLILFMWMFVTGAAVGLTVLLIQYYPLFRAMAVLQVESPTMKMPLKLGEAEPAGEAMVRFINNQAMLLKDEQVLREALQDAGVMATAWYKSQVNADEALDELNASLGVSHQPQSSLLRVTFSTREPKDAPIIINTVISKYLFRVQKMSEEDLNEDVKNSRTEEGRLRKELDRIREDKQGFIESQPGTVGVNSGFNAITDTWRALAERVTNLEAEKLQYQTAYENLIAVDPADIAISPQMQQMIQQDPRVLALNNQLLEWEQESEAKKKQGFGSKHREMLGIESRIKTLRETLLQVEHDRELAVRDNEINAAHTMFLNAAQAEMQLRERLLEAESKQRDLDRNLARYQSMEEQHLELTERLRDIRAFISQLQLVLSERGGVRVRQISSAQPPHERYFPKWQVFVPGGLLFGLLLGVGLALLLEFVDTSVKTTRDLIRHVHVPILGTVPDLDDEEVDIERMELATHLAPRSMIAEAFRTFRTNLLLSAPLEQQRSVLVTSAKPEEGKTAVAVNLAISVGQSGRRVLLVDANFHRPALRQVFPITQEEGLSNILIGQRTLEDGLIFRTDLPNLDVLTSGPIPPNPAELLAGPYMEKFIAQAAQRYDQVIFDGPPVLLLSDTLVLAGAVDGVILVCRAKASLRGAVQRAREQLERVNARVLGAVLNAAQIARGGYFREQIRTYYDYQPAEAAVVKTLHELPERKGADQLDHDEPENA